MSGGVVSGRECHEEVTDEDGHAEPCNKPAVGWRIEPEENTPYPVCSLHHRWPYADEWVAAQERIARVEAVCEEATERAYWDISLEKELTVQPNGPGRAKVPGHWREAAEGEARVTVVDLRKALADVSPAAGRELATNPERGPRCGECRLGLGVHEPRDPQCVRHDEAAR